jgi:hypothetical protein
MRVSFQYFSSRVLIAAGTGALLVLVIVLITGGFELNAGRLRFSAHRWTVPLFIALVAWLGAAFLGRDRVCESTSALTRFLDRHAPAIAVVLAATLTSVGISHGTYSASSADAAGYVSQAYLLSSGHLLREEPLARQVGWPDPEWTFSPLGYRPGPHAGEIAPTYPPGLPVVMAAARTAAGDAAPFGVTPGLGAVAVLSTFALGTLLHSRLAGLVAATLLATSPIVLFQVVQPMSDVPVTAWWTLAWLFALTPIPQAPFAASATAGIAILTRPNLGPLTLVVALALALARRWRGCAFRTCWLPFAVGLVPAVGALCLVNWRLYGSPFASGYGGIGDLFSFQAILPNARAYAMRVLQGELPALALTACAVVVELSFRLKPEATGAPAATGVAEATGAPAATGDIATWVDAWRGEVYAALYTHGREVMAPVVEHPDSLLANLPAATRGPITFVGDGAGTYRDLISRTLGDRARIPEPSAPLLAAVIAQLATEAASAGGHLPSPHAIRPLYVRRPDAELARAQKVR